MKAVLDHESAQGLYQEAWSYHAFDGTGVALDFVVVAVFLE